MLSPTKLAALLSAFSVAIISAAPTPIAAAPTCSTTFPATFKIKEANGYFEVKSGTIIHDSTKSTASYFYINETVWQGPTIPQLSYSASGKNYGVFITNSVDGIIVLVPTASTATTTDLPVTAGLMANCGINLLLSESHTDSYLQDCSGVIEFATSVKTGCTQVSASLVT
ncbi:hypothetical protein LTR36_009001 [Oleoguttula mirabilis]|uniref:Uncharacterized protein n=1 Tax=Oleoguttula mirabilis TaxID=1507867 RepID=A0AAV9J6U7_9PEZI|nr:hypothetical protein LTR36_009001 [Oleoguttula mirabilis]